MRVALVTPGFHPEIGGIEAYVRSLAHELTALNCQVDVLTQCPRGGANGWTTSEEGSAIHVLRFPDWTGTRRFRISPQLWTYLRHHGREYDIIHAHNFAAFPAFASAVATSGPFVFTPYYHGAGHTPAAKLLHLPYDRLAKRIFARSAYVLCISTAEADLVKQHFPSYCSRVHEVGIGLDLEGIRQAVAFERERPVVLVMGRLEAYKHVERAVEAFVLSGIEADMVIVGTGPERGNIEDLVDRLGVANRIQFVGRVEDVDARRWQQTASVVMSLSSAESFGLGVAEAAAAGARIVASDIPAHRDVAGMVGDAFEFVPLGADTRVIEGALRRALAATGEAPGECTLPAWNEVGERVYEFYGKALSRQAEDVAQGLCERLGEPS